MKKLSILLTVGVLSICNTSYGIKFPNCGGSICGALEHAKKEVKKEVKKIGDQVNTITKDLGDSVVSLGNELVEINKNVIDLKLDLITFGEHGRARDKQRAKLALLEAKQKLEIAIATLKTREHEQNLRKLDLETFVGWLDRIKFSADILVRSLQHNLRNAKEISKGYHENLQSQSNKNQLIAEQMRDLETWIGKLLISLQKSTVESDKKFYKYIKNLDQKVKIYNYQQEHIPGYLRQPEFSLEALLEFAIEAESIANLVYQQIEDTRKDTLAKIEVINQSIAKTEQLIKELEK